MQNRLKWGPCIAVAGGYHIRLSRLYLNGGAVGLESWHGVDIYPLWVRDCTFNAQKSADVSLGRAIAYCDGMTHLTAARSALSAYRTSGSYRRHFIAGTTKTDTVVDLIGAGPTYRVAEGVYDFETSVPDYNVRVTPNDEQTETRIFLDNLAFANVGLAHVALRAADRDGGIRGTRNGRFASVRLTDVGGPHASAKVPLVSYDSIALWQPTLVDSDTQGQTRVQGPPPLPTPVEPGSVPGLLYRDTGSRWTPGPHRLPKGGRSGSVTILAVLKLVKGGCVFQSAPGQVGGFSLWHNGAILEGSLLGTGGSVSPYTWTVLAARFDGKQHQLSAWDNGRPVDHCPTDPAVKLVWSSPVLGAANSAGSPASSAWQDPAGTILIYDGALPDATVAGLSAWLLAHLPS